MIALLKKKRGRPAGSRTRAPSTAPGMRISGAATSAAKMNHRPGFAALSTVWVYIRGEGFVRWSEIEAQVQEAYLQWRRKKSLEGVLIYDWEEARQNDMTRGHGQGPARQKWLREWQQRHAELCERAAA